jgi:hypothetical protein
MPTNRSKKCENEADTLAYHAVPARDHLPRQNTAFQYVQPLHQSGEGVKVLMKLPLYF